MDPSVLKIYQHLPVQDTPKFTQIWIFGLKTNHLATLETIPLVDHAAMANNKSVA
jgi:hypothetical protein